MSVVALEYHDVIDGDDWSASGFPGNSADSYKMAGALFEAHLDAVGRMQNDTGRDVRQIAMPPGAARTVLFTFDDGGASAAHAIADRLDRHGWLGHFLVTTGRIGTPGFLGRAELQDLHRRGHVVGTHTESHPARMSLVAPLDQVNEWRRSRETLEDILGAVVDVASVPGGYFDRACAEAAATAGIRWLFTSEPEERIEIVNGCAVIGRFTLRRNSGAPVARALVGGPGLARTGQWLKWNAKKVAKNVAGDTYLRLRASLFGDTSP